ncbi:MAG: hypothetical protein HY834_13540 [Devosia nanyangense]|uniref:Antitoxin Xre/MbcA/ParS-like toxin-binding domain-containing protein n=1 Tax=Devosia nanyangense TaxID=1228055 RepID=A0A933L1Y9_9HYPH|nr:hypothetical protein [Devosia nanyangense]
MPAIRKTAAKTAATKAAAKKPAKKPAAKPAAAAKAPVRKAASKPAAKKRADGGASLGVAVSAARGVSKVRAGVLAERERIRNTAARLPAESAHQLDARARAILRGREIAEEDLRTAGGSYSLIEVQGLLHGISRQGVQKRVAARDLLAVPGPNNKRRFPALQFNDDGSLLTGLPEVTSAMPTRNGWAILNFLVNPASALGNLRPIDLLRRGDVEHVVAAARMIGEPGR